MDMVHLTILRFGSPSDGIYRGVLAIYGDDRENRVYGDISGNLLNVQRSAVHHRHYWQEICQRQTQQVPDQGNELHPIRK